MVRALHRGSLSLACMRYGHLRSNHTSSTRRPRECSEKLHKVFDVVKISGIFLRVGFWQPSEQHNSCIMEKTYPIVVPTIG